MPLSGRGRGVTTNGIKCHGVCVLLLTCDGNRDRHTPTTRPPLSCFRIQNSYTHPTRLAHNPVHGPLNNYKYGSIALEAAAKHTKCNCLKPCKRVRYLVLHPHSAPVTTQIHHPTASETIRHRIDCAQETHRLFNPCCLVVLSSGHFSKSSVATLVPNLSFLSVSNVCTDLQS